MNTSSLSRKIEQELNKLTSRIKKPNILITGITGVGKSSLVNTVFGKKIAETGIGEPITANLTKYTDADVPIVLYDTAGYEVDTDINPVSREETFKFISGHGKGSPEDRVHFAWYVIDASGGRIVSVDIDMCRRFRENNIPFAVVLAKCDLVSRKDLNQLISIVKKSIGNSAVFSVTNLNIPGNGYLELENLINWSNEQLPKTIHLAFIKAQRVNLKLKRLKALAVVSGTSTLNFGIGFIPIPFSDAPLLLASQGAMLASIIYIYETKELGILKTALTTSFTALLGVTTAGTIMKYFPGIGTIAGGLVNGTVGSVITVAMGITTVTICHKYYAETLEKGDSSIALDLERVSAEFSKLASNSFQTIKSSRWKYKKILNKELKK